MEARPISLRPDVARRGASPRSTGREVGDDADHRPGPAGGTESGADRTGVAAVDRALKLLGTWREEDTALPLHELARRTGLYKSTILRLMASLEAAGCVRRRPDGRWLLGAQAFRWGALYQRGLDRGGRVTAALSRLSAASGEGASYWAREREHGVCVAATSGEKGAAAPPRPGDRAPADLLALGEGPRASPERMPGEVLVLSWTAGAGTLALGAPVLDLTEARQGVLVLVGGADRMRAGRDTLEPLLRAEADALSAALRAH